MDAIEKEKIDKQNKELYKSLLGDNNNSIWRQYEKAKDDRRDTDSDVRSKA